MLSARITTLAIFGMALPASAAIVSVTGMTNWLVTPPASCVPTALTGPFAYTWNEQQNVFVNSLADMVTNPSSSNAPTPGFVNGIYDSHFLHFDNQTGTPPAQGTITFNNPIVAVIYKGTVLDTTDASPGALGTIYPTTYLWRGLATAPSSFVTILGNTLTFDLNTFSPVYVIDQVRILTQAPAPASAALLGLAGVAGMRRRRN